jgi:hypothetical protein
MMSHFDEVYVLPRNWTSQNIEMVPSFSVDLCSFGEGVPAEFQIFFNQIGALRYFTDGAGFPMNYCVSSDEDSAALEQAAIEVRSKGARPPA